jgi:uncharacterized protein YgiB involved in biofilm formation
VHQLTRFFLSSFKGFVYKFGGVESDGNTFTAKANNANIATSVQCYNPSTHEWCVVAKARMNQARVQGVAIFIPHLASFIIMGMCRRPCTQFAHDT